jgi:hypothetical protein
MLAVVRFNPHKSGGSAVSQAHQNTIARQKRTERRLRAPAKLQSLPTLPCKHHGKKQGSNRKMRQQPSSLPHEADQRLKSLEKQLQTRQEIQFMRLGHLKQFEQITKRQQQQMGFLERTHEEQLAETEKQNPVGLNELNQKQESELDQLRQTFDDEGLAMQRRHEAQISAKFPDQQLQQPRTQLVEEWKRTHGTARDAQRPPSKQMLQSVTLDALPQHLKIRFFDEKAVLRPAASQHKKKEFRWYD